MPYFQNGSTIGADLNNAADTAQFTPGQRASGSQDTMWVYVEGVGTITTGMICTMTTGFTATPALTSAAQAAANAYFVFPQCAMTSGQFAWACYHGNNVYIRVSGTCSVSAQMYIAVTSGVLHTTSASSTMQGIVMIANTSATATNQAVLANLTWPRALTNFS